MSIFLSQGLTEPSGLCSEGYYCKTGSTSPTPDEESMGGECQAGYYCPEGKWEEGFRAPLSVCEKRDLIFHFSQVFMTLFIFWLVSSMFL